MQNDNLISNEPQNKIIKTVKKSFFRSLIEFTASLIIIVIAANLIHKFIFHPFYVIGESMEPSFHDGSYLFVEKLSYRFGPIQRGDVVVFTPPWDPQNMLVQKDKNFYGPVFFQFKKWFSKFQRIVGIPAKNLENREYIKRIIGLPGEVIKINNQSQIILKNSQYPEGVILLENYIKPPTNGSLEVALNNDEYFVLGDNRPNSSDSRGTVLNGKNTNPHIVPKNSIEGKVFVRLWPLKDLGFINKVNYKFLPLVNINE